MKLKEWNEILVFANEVCKRLIKNGYIVKSIVYGNYSNEKGICIYVYDKNGNVFEKYHSGIYKTIEEYKKALIKIEEQIKREC